MERAIRAVVPFGTLEVHARRCGETEGGLQKVWTRETGANKFGYPGHIALILLRGSAMVKDDLRMVSVERAATLAVMQV